jgi:hypothetical protein
MICKRTLEWSETKLANIEVTPEATWSAAKSHINRDGPRAATAIQGSSGLKLLFVRESQRNCRLLENQLTPNDLCEDRQQTMPPLKD